MAAPITDSCPGDEIDNFKHVYKRYKRRDRPVDTKHVIDFKREDITDNPEVESYQLFEPEGMSEFPGMKPVKEWKAFQLKNYKGFVVIRNPFKARYQRYWIQRCILDFPRKPNRTNLDAHMERPSQVWHHCVDDDRPDLKKDSLLMKLRWATLGYQYEWNTKEYFADRIQSFPDDLSLMCSYIAAALGYPHYSSEAGIVNYYRMESTLMGHTDVSELDKAAPLISFSFAQSCIFLIGGPTKETEPLPVFLHSGDICLMLGQARLSFHAVPRIMPANETYLQTCFHGNTEQIHPCGQALSGHLEAGNNNLKSESEKQSNGFSCKEVTERQAISESDENSNAGDDDPYSDPVKNKQEREQIIRTEPSSEVNETIIPTVSEKGNQCQVAELQTLMDHVIETVSWEPFDMYCKTSRVNVNVRQVMKKGLSLPICPETIVPLPCLAKMKT